MSSVRGSCTVLGLFAVLICCLFAPPAGAYAGNIASSADPLMGYVTSAAFSGGSDPALPAGFPADDFNGCAGCHGTNNAGPTQIMINSPGAGCLHTNNTAPCSDGNACTTGDTCAAGACVGGA